ncbi:hypothetical protein AKJ36_03095 [candidate division MSBL1 archaeon SCGC-AAA259I07]|uniref:Uncharacterized protein n=1 Tax=candidate division MSBL1 archaeon SCGC-AAA259I07 TaxID=1698266 RepID=A0A133UJD0_9EURY|nr:hypothetical protein AKJ36_03095 [candidate division MSBL1 archaeon SCGC-AAA259I07]
MEKRHHRVLHCELLDYCTYVEDDTKYLRIGRSKEGVVGRRLVGLALALSDKGVPVLGEAYPGNRTDVELFPGLFRRVVLSVSGLLFINPTVKFTDPGDTPRFSNSLALVRES